MGELAYVPQFSIAHDLLTVDECVASAVALRTRQKSVESEDELIERSLKVTGLTALADRPVKVLSGGQKRRLGLALELVTDPNLLLCDEVTSGLDPKSEAEITQLLHDLARKNDRRVVINVTHSLSNLGLYDSVLVLHEGRVVYHGPPRAMMHYFSVEQAEEIYPKLARRSSERWSASWKKYRDTYYEAYGFPVSKPAGQEPTVVKDREPERIRLPKAAAEEGEEPGEDTDDETLTGGQKPSTKSEYLEAAKEHQTEYELPGVFAQTRELVSRRWTIFWRDKAQVWLQAAMMLGFPFLVIIFGLDGIPQLHQLTSTIGSLPNEAKDQAAYLASELKAGGLVSGLIMLQVVLVTLMASNNAAREIAAERDILERERLGGLRPSAYLISKVIFLGVLVLAQSLWMGLFVFYMVPGIPGDLLARLGLLVMASGGMTAICLGISGIMKSPEKATILSIYLVGFQLPLSGAVLKLPIWLEPVVRPFIAAYWGWAGSLATMKATVYFDAVTTVAASAKDAPAANVAAFVLAMHVLVGLLLAYVGIKKSQWE